MLTGMGIRVTQQGMQAFVEHDKRTGKPVRVNIPHVPDNATEELLLAIQGFIDHEVGHVLFTDFSVQKRAHRLGSDYYSFWNICEDPYVEGAMQRRFPGSAQNLQRMHQFFIEEITKPALDDARKGEESLAREFNIVVVPIVRAWYGQKVFSDFMAPLWGRYAKYVDRIKHLRPKIEAMASSADALKVAIEIRNALLDPPKKRPEEPPATPPAAPPPSSKEEEPEAGKPGEGEGAEGADAETEKNEDFDLHDRHEEETPASESDPSADDDAESDGDDEGGDGSETGDDSAAEDGPTSTSKGERKDDAEDADEGDGTDDEGVAEGDRDVSADDDADDAEGDNPSDDSAGDEVSADDTPADEAGERGTGPGVEVEDGGAGSLRLTEEEGESDAGERIAREILEAMRRDGVKDFDDVLAKAISDEALSAAQDSFYRIFTTDFDVIEPFTVDDGSYKSEWMTGMDDETRSMIGVLQKDIERLMAARSQAVKVPGFKSGRLHSGSLYRLAAGDDRVFRRIQEAKSNDVAVGLLVDCSGSMRGIKIHTACAAAYALSQTLERVRVRHEVVGFTTYDEDMPREVLKRMNEEARRLGGRGFSRTERLWMPIFKGMQERMTPEVRRRFAAAPYQAGLCNNVDGECVEIAARRLLACPEKRKVLLVLSDGMPSAYGDISALSAHLKHTVNWAESAGVETIGIGILSDAVKRYYSKSIVLNRVSELPRAVMKELKDVLVRA